MEGCAVLDHWPYNFAQPATAATSRTSRDTSGRSRRPAGWRRARRRPASSERDGARQSARRVAMSTTPTTPPIREERTKVRMTILTPRKAPIIASILTSPKPIASTLRSRNHSLGNQPRGARRRARSRRGTSTGPGGTNQLHRKPIDDAGKRDDVGQDLVLEIDGEQHDQGAREQQPDEQQRRGPEDVPVQQEDRRGQRFDDRVAQRNREPAGPAASPEHGVAAGPGCCPTRRAAGRSRGSASGRSTTDPPSGSR